MFTANVNKQQSTSYSEFKSCQGKIVLILLLLPFMVTIAGLIPSQLCWKSY